MALQSNKTTGKAVADIRALYFYNHKNGEPVITDTLTSPGDADWFPVLTLRGTVTSSQDAPSIEKINVDQFDAAIGISTEAGDFNFEAQLPSLSKGDIEKWLGTDLEVKGSDGETIEVDGNELIGFNLDGKLFDMSAMIKTRTGATIIFARVQVSFSFTKEDKVFVFRVSGQVLAPTNDKNRMIYLATEPKQATV